MTLDVRIDSNLGPFHAREQLRESARQSLERLGPRLDRLELRLRRLTRNKGGRVVARLSGFVQGVGDVHVRSYGSHHFEALSGALARFRRAAFGSLSKTRRGRVRSAA